MNNRTKNDRMGKYVEDDVFASVVIGMLYGGGALILWGTLLW
jgi:hypothetical protein